MQPLNTTPLRSLLSITQEEAKQLFKTTLPVMGNMESFQLTTDRYGIKLTTDHYYLFIEQNGYVEARRITATGIETPEAINVVRMMALLDLLNIGVTTL